VGAVQPQTPHRSRTRPARDNDSVSGGDQNEQRRPGTALGADDRGIELEIIAVVLPDIYLVIHVMPTALRSRTR
jgi:hypothetical protein